MKNLSTFIPENLINAFGWTIFHSLWQGLLIGLIVFLIYKYRRNLSSQTRYLLGILALAAIVASSLFTFFMAYHPVSSQAELITYTSANISNLQGISETSGELSHLNPVSPGWQQSLTGTFNIVSIIWLFGVLLLMLRLAGGLLVIDGMSRRGILPLPFEWTQRLSLLAHKTGVHRSVTYLQSKKIQIPTVIGILKPVVLIPSMIISGLPADQLETILVHELAHIRRYDFLVNIMQTIIEALLFYHPVVWIISENVRQEREKCCDDLTIKVCGKVSLYARALARLSELQLTPVIPSVAVTGNKKSILYRVERLINNQKMKTNTAERLIAGLVLVTSVLVITLSTGATLKPSGSAQMETRIELPFLDKKRSVPVTDPEPAAQPTSVVAPASYATPSLVAEPAVITEPIIDAKPVIISDTSVISPDTPVAVPSASAKVALPLPVSIPAPVALPLPVSIPAPVALPSPLAIPAPVAVPAPVAIPASKTIPGPAPSADTSQRHERGNMDIKDNKVTRKFHNKEGEEQEMKFMIKQGKVKELYVDGQRIPENEFSKYQKEIDVTMEDLQDMERDLKNAKAGLKQVDFDKIRKEMEFGMQHFNQAEMSDLKEEMRALQEEQFKMKLDEKELQAEIEQAMKDVQIDQDKLQEEMFKAQEEITKAMKEFEQGKYNLSEEEFEQAMKDMERGLAEAKEGMAMMQKEDMQKLMDEALKSVQEIDYEKMHREIQEAMENIKEIDFEEIEKEMQEAMQNFDVEEFNLDKEKNNIDEMIKELEKLELDKK